MFLIPTSREGYAVPGGGVVTVPLDGPVALEELRGRGGGGPEIELKWDLMVISW